MKNSKQNNGQNEQLEKIKFSEKLACGINNGTGTFHIQVIQLFLLFYYTDVMQISAAYVAVLFLVVRVFDAILTPFFGIMMDKLTTPWGKYKPWVVLSGALMAIFGFLTFTNFNFDPTGKLVYVTVTYVLYSIFLSMIGAPCSAISPLVTKRVEDRLSMGQIGYFTIMIGALLAQIAVQPLYKAIGGGNDAKGFSVVMGAVMVFSIGISIWQNVVLHERYISKPKVGDKGPSVGKMLKAVLTNKTALIVYMFAFAINLSNGLRNGVQIYYFKYYFNNEMLVTISGMVALLPTLIGVIFSSKFTKRIGIKKNLILSAIVTIISMAVVIILPPTSIGVVAYLITMALMGFFTGLANPAQGTMMPAAIDYTEWKTGMNINGFMSSFQGFLQTLATAISGALAAGALHVFGYIEGAAVQSDYTISGLKIIMSIIPAVITVLTLSIVWFDLTEGKQAEITKELAERRKGEETEELQAAEA
jgi:sugar (glycoside-pentoside-hexuronide) transporter